MKNRAFDDTIGTGNRGSVCGVPEAHDFFILTGIVQNNGLHDADTALPDLLPAPGVRTKYTFDFRSAVWGGREFAPLKQAIYTLSSLTLDASRPRPCRCRPPACWCRPGWVTPGWVRRRGQG